MKDEFAEINVIPLVDIMLVLLVIVLMTANFMVQGMLPIQPPKSEAKDVPQENSVHIALTFEGELYYENQPLPLEALVGQLHELDPKRLIVIRADRDGRIQPFVELVDAVKGLGFTSIHLQTQR